MFMWHERRYFERSGACVTPSAAGQNIYDMDIDGGQEMQARCTSQASRMPDTLSGPCASSV
jgi:hypothetical protein